MTRYYLNTEILIKTDSDLEIDQLRLAISDAICKNCPKGSTFVIVDSCRKKND